MAFASTNLANQLHVTVFDAVVDHLYVVAGTFVTNPLAACLAIALGGNALEDALDVRPGLLIATRHQGRAIASTLLTSGHTGTNEANVFGGTVLCATVGVGEMGVPAVNNDISRAEQRDELVNVGVNSLAGLDKEHDAARRLELANELLDAVGADNRLSLGLVFEESVDFGDGSVEGADGEAVVGHVHDEVLSPWNEGQHVHGVDSQRAERGTHMTARPMRPRSALGNRSAWLGFDAGWEFCAMGEEDVFAPPSFRLARRALWWKHNEQLSEGEADAKVSGTGADRLPGQRGSTPVQAAIAALEGCAILRSSLGAEQSLRLRGGVTRRDSIEGLTKGRLDDLHGARHDGRAARRAMDELGMAGGRGGSVTARRIEVMAWSEMEGREKLQEGGGA